MYGDCEKRQEPRCDTVKEFLETLLIHSNFMTDSPNKNCVVLLEVQDGAKRGDGSWRNVCLNKRGWEESFRETGV
ncbi:uncharacterized [Tachysurus ichikawai]